MIDENKINELALKIISEELCDIWNLRQEDTVSTNFVINGILELRDSLIDAINTLIISYPELAEPILEQWNKEHPVQTRADKLRELFPSLKMNNDGLPEMCPPEFDCKLKCEAELSDCEYSEKICNKCRRDFWTAEHELPKKE